MSACTLNCEFRKRKRERRTKEGGFEEVKEMGISRSRDSTGMRRMRKRRGGHP